MIHFDFSIFIDDRIKYFKTVSLFSTSNFLGKGKSSVSYFKFKVHVLNPTGRQAINQVFHKLMILSFQTRRSANAISQEQIVLRVFLICLTIGLGKEPGKNKSLRGVLLKLCVLP